MVDCCVHGNEPSGSMKSEEFLDQLNDYQIFKEDCLPHGVSVHYAMAG
jgi:hypothetical protein